MRFGLREKRGVQADTPRFIFFIDIRNENPTIFMQGASLQSQR